MVNPTYGIEMVSSQAALDQDWQAVGEALSQLGAHSVAALGFAHTWTGILQWLAVIAAMYVPRDLIVLSSRAMCDLEVWSSYSVGCAYPLFGCCFFQFVCGVGFLFGW